MKATADDSGLLRCARNDDRGISSLFCAAIITSPHGIQGQVKIKCFLEDPAEFKVYSPYYNEQGEEAYTVIKVLSQDKDVLIVALEGIPDRNAAEHLKGVKLMLSRQTLPKLEEDTFYHADLMGLRVMSSQNKPFGRVHALYNFGAGDILEVETDQGKLVMLPFTHDIVPEINVKEGFVGLSDVGDLLIKGESDGA
ncbi:MAG: 16S rRNA processing protein RimM [Proteobacteria bacterium]|nr:16S rRNA processing protein RimM [Pseudomonadota bacterium]